MNALISSARRRASAGSLALLLGLAACTTPPPPQGVSSLPAAAPEGALRVASTPAYLIAAGDELELRFPDQPSYDQTVRVRPDGKLTLPLIGTVHAQGRTPEDVQDELHERYRALAGGQAEKTYLIQAGDELEIKFAYQPSLNEVVKVRPDGKVALQLAGTLAAQGLSPEALQAELTKRYARVLRQPELAVIMRSFQTQAVALTTAGGASRTGRAGAERLLPTVALKASTPEQVFVGGEVQRPGVLAFKPGMTLMQALIEAGGQLPTGEMRAVTVLRRPPAGVAGAQPLVIRRDLAADLAGTARNDIALQPTDVVVLPSTSVASLAQTLDQYVFKLIPPLRNSSFGFTYDLRGRRN